jgi:outer membrane protein assembly factor BamA
VKWLLLIYGILSFSGSLPAQHRLQLLPATPADANFIAALVAPAAVASRAEGWQFVQNSVEDWQLQGYLEAHIADYTFQDSLSTYQISVGPQYNWVSLQSTAISPKVWRQTGFRARDFVDKEFSYTRLARFMNRLVSISENSGYPFAQARLDSIRIIDQKVEAKLLLEQGPLITFDSVIVEGSAKLKESFITSYLNIKYGEPYEQKVVDQISRRLQQLPYVKLSRPPRLNFENNRARIYIYADKQNSSQFEGIAALQSKPDGGTLLTGQVDLLLQNPFGGGRGLLLNWRRLNTSSQQLNLSYRQPYLFGSPLSIEGAFRLYKESEDFLNRNLEATAEIQQASGAVFQVLLQQRDTRLLENGNQPDLASFRINQYGLGFRLNTVNSLIFPSNGWRFSSSLMAGPKKLRALPANFEDTTVLDNSVLHLAAEFNAATYQRLAGRTVLVFKGQAAWLYDEYLFVPDLYRLGGLYSLRGFREQSVLASRFAVLQTELRQRIGEASYVLLFYDQAYIGQELAAQAYAESWPLGVGAGINLSSRAGVFSLVYAIGKPGSQRFSTQNSQVQFGYISRF